MSVRAARWLLFLLMALTLPLPLLGPMAAFAPTVRYALLAAATGAIALTEGAAGPVLGLLGLFLVHVVVGLGLCWLIGWLGSITLRRLSDRLRGALVIVLAVSVLGVALSIDLYETPFGRAPTGTLIGVLS